MTIAVACLAIVTGIAGFATAVNDAPVIDGPAIITRRAVRLVPQVPVAAEDPSVLLAHDMADLVNAERAARKLTLLRWDDRVAAAALGHSVYQADRSTMTHVGSDGSDAGDRLTRAGYVWSTWGETLAAGSTNAPAMLDAWLASPGHAERLFEPAVRDVGVGVATSASGVPYWTLVTAAP